MGITKSSGDSLQFAHVNTADVVGRMSRRIDYLVKLEKIATEREQIMTANTHRIQHLELSHMLADVVMSEDDQVRQARQRFNRELSS